MYRRKDGRYVGAAIVPTASGARKRVVVYGRTRLEASAKLAEVLAKASAGVPVPDRPVKLADYLDYWLENIVKPNKEASTWDTYEVVCRLYLKPGLGRYELKRLTLPIVQTYFAGLLAEGKDAGRVKTIRTVLSAALTRAQREELILRNVARLVELPQYQRKKIVPWTVAEAQEFLEATDGHRLHAAFVLLVLYGLRRGEVLGLRWCDVDFMDRQVHIRQQLQDLRHSRGPTIGSLKTRASERDLPLLPTVATVLAVHFQRQAQARTSLGGNWYGSGDDSELVFTSEVGTPLHPGNFVTTFKALCARHGVREIKLHHIRHTTATMMKDVGVPAHDAQLILGHASSWVTEQIYQHDTIATRTANLAKIEAVMVQTHRNPGYLLAESGSALLSTLQFDSNLVANKTAVQSVKSAQSCISVDPKRNTLAEGFSLLQEEKQECRSDQPVFLYTRRQCRLGGVAISAATQLPLIVSDTSVLWLMNVQWYIDQQI